MTRWLLRLWLVFFSAGWLAPFTLSITAAYDFLWRWVWPLAALGDGSQVSPFHLFEWSPELLYLSMGWLALVIAYWVVRATPISR